MWTSLSDLEADALTELVNVSVSKAAVTLSRMMRGGVSLTVPRVRIVPREEATAALRTDEADDRLVAVGEAFDGPFAGSAVLVFPVSNSLELVRAVLPHLSDLDEIIEMEQEALSEIGNIIINSCLSTLANMLQERITTSLPRVIYGGAGEILVRPDADADDADRVMVFHVDFLMRERGIRGFFVIVMSVSSMMALRASVQRLMDACAAEAAGRPTPH
ncbi:chemotaxis protein CheC [Azospirillum sp. ST 5-10]|uniref:chemotaxis protein CheC n=1 Tax=unclassified Azospirillum TaxID=2630922 RepID=UPI003F4A669C